jgi:hypothetical protein
MEQRFPIGGEAETFVRVPPWAPAPSELADFAGTYENAALGLSLVQFTRNREGRVTGYIVHLPRAWRIPFTRSGQ